MNHNPIMPGVPRQDATSSDIELELAKLTDQRIGNDVVSIATEVIKQADIDRLATGAELINAFNYAIQTQAKRQLWSASDYRAFAIALAAMNEIKPE